MRMLLLEPRPFRTVADDELAAAPGHVQESVDVLFDRHAPHIGGDRARQGQKVLRVGLEYVGIHAAAPTGQVVEALRGQIPAHRGGAHHAAHGGAVKPAQRAVRGLERDWEPCAQILGKLRVIGGGEADTPADAETPRAQAQRAFGCDVQRLRREAQDALFHFSIGQDREADFRIGWTGDAVKIARLNDSDLMTETPEPCGGMRERADDAVGLRKPCIGDNHDSHAPSPSHDAMTKR